MGPWEAITDTAGHTETHFEDMDMTSVSKTDCVTSWRRFVKLQEPLQVILIKETQYEGHNTPQGHHTDQGS